jgi:hypothetical protein
MGKRLSTPAFSRAVAAPQLVQRGPTLIGKRQSIAGTNPAIMLLTISAAKV